MTGVEWEVRRTGECRGADDGGLIDTGVFVDVVCAAVAVKGVDVISQVRASCQQYGSGARTS